MTIYQNVITFAYFFHLEDEDEEEEEQDYPEDDEAAEQLDTDADAKEYDQGISPSNEPPFHCCSICFSEFLGYSSFLKLNRYLNIYINCAK